MQSYGLSCGKSPGIGASCDIENPEEDKFKKTIDCTPRWQHRVNVDSI